MSLPNLESHQRYLHTYIYIYEILYIIYLSYTVAMESAGD